MNRYEEAILEYKEETEDGQYQLIYAYFGLAVYTAQCLEEAFSQMLWINRIIKKDLKTNQEINTIIDSIENSRKTMGNFINEVKQSYDLTDELQNKLQSVLRKRNYLVHHYFKSEIEKFYSDIGRKEMLNYLCSFIDQSNKIEQELIYYYDKYKKKLGLTDKVVEEMMNQLIETEKSRDNKS